MAPRGAGGLGAGAPYSDEFSKAQSSTRQHPPHFELFWHGKKYDRERRSWLVKDLIFENGIGLASGQWGTAKTFGMLDLSASVMTGTPFAGREIIRRGGVVFIAAEGASEIPIRLEGLVEKLRPSASSKGALGQVTAADLDSLPCRGLPEPPEQ